MARASREESDWPVPNHFWREWPFKWGSANNISQVCDQHGLRPTTPRTLWFQTSHDREDAAATSVEASRVTKRGRYLHAVSKIGGPEQRHHRPQPSRASVFARHSGHRADISRKIRCSIMGSSHTKKRSRETASLDANALGHRIRKPGVRSASPAGKRQKVANVVPAKAPAAAVIEAPAAASAPQSTPLLGRESVSSSSSQIAGLKTPQKNSQQLRISDLLAADRAQRAARRHAITPRAIVAAVPHIDTRRPDNTSPALQSISVQKKQQPAKAITLNPPAQAVHVPGSVKPRQPRHAHRRPPRAPLPQSDAVLAVLSTAPKKATDNRRKANDAVPSVIPFGSRPAESTAGKVRASGGEAILYDRTLLPEKHTALLDILAGMEQAQALLATRKAVPDFGAIRASVSASVKRSFSARQLSQIAAILPEGVAVLPPTGTTLPTTKQTSVGDTPYDRLVVRLDNVERSPSASMEATKVASAEVQGRRRMQLLHKRLYEHTSEWHKRFLRRNRIQSFHGNLWHEDFDPDVHVPDLPAPSLDGCTASRVRSQADGDSNEDPASTEPAQTKYSAAPRSANSESDSRCEIDADEPPRQAASAPESAVVDEKESPDDLVPSSLLARVRARAAAVAARQAEAPRTAERLLIQRLPATMDAVRSILTSSRRSAMGWTALVSETADKHPCGWSKADIDEQLLAITKLGQGWCERKTLSGPRGGYAFKVVDENKFSNARKFISTASSLGASST